MTPKRTIRAARHEAAHAVLAQSLGWPLRWAVLDKDGSGGHVEHRRSRTPCRFELALIALAGSAAEHKWHRQSRLKWSSEDAKFAAGLGFGNRALHTIWHHARGMVDELAPEIEAVAQELKRRDLTGPDVRRIIKGAR